MKAKKFKQQTHILEKPKGIENYGKLPIHFSGSQCISKWKLNFFERLRILWHGTIFVGVYSSTPAQPPLYVVAKRNIFKPKKENTSNHIDLNQAKK